MTRIDSFVGYLKSDRGYSPGTLRRYRDSLVALWQFFTRLDEELTWETLDADILRGWIVQRMENGVSPRAVGRDMSAVRSFYKFLLLTGVVEKDPSHLVRNPKAGKPLPTFLKEAEMDRLFDDVTFPPDFTGLRDRTLLLTFYHTGVRVSELVGLDCGDVDLQQRQLKVTGKRNKQRVIPFGEELHSQLELYVRQLDARAADGASPLFVTAGGARMTVPQVRATVKAYLAGVTSQKKKTPHVLRHTFATVMLNNGADMEAVKELLGHESLATTEIYTHTTFSELRKAYEHAHPRA